MIENRREENEEGNEGRNVEVLNADLVRMFFS